MKTYINKLKKAIALFAILAISIVSCDDGDIVDNSKLPDFTDAELISLEFVALDMPIVAKKRSDNEFVFGISPRYTEESLKGIIPNITVSHGATIEPKPSVPQDFYENIVYTVTAENGTKKEWTVSWEMGGMLEDGEGFGSYDFVWGKTHAQLGTSSGVNSIALCGDYLVSSTVNVVIDKKTGAPTDKKLNTTGVKGGHPALVASDDFGNLIGSNNNEYQGPELRIYRWKTIDSNPEEIIHVPNPVGGRTKLSVIGNMNADAVILAPIASVDGQYYRWEVKGGVVNPQHEIFKTNVPSNDGSWRQNIHPLTLEKDSPYFMTDGISSAATFVYVEDGRTHTVQNPGKGGSTGWGNYGNGHCYAFPFNGKTYALNISSTWGANFLSLVDKDNLSELIFTEELQRDITAAEFYMTSVMTPDGYSRLVYVYTASYGVRVYSFNNYR